MKTFFVPLALFVTVALAQSFSIDTPASVTECEPTLLQWHGGTAPYYVTYVILPGSSPNGTPLESFPSNPSNSVTWVCNVQANTQIGFTVRDSTGAVAQSAPVVVISGSSTSCLNTTSLAPGPTAASIPAGSSTAGGSGGSGGSGTSATGTVASSSASASATSKSSGASANIAQFGSAGIIGAAVAALLF